MRTLWATGTLAVAFAALSNAAASAPRDDCRDLRGTDLAPAASVKLVQRGPAASSQLITCSVRDGRLHLLASSSDGEEYTETYSLGQLSGGFLALTTSVEDKYASSARTTLVDLRTGAQRRLASFQNDTMSAPGPGARAVEVVVTSGGRAGASVIDTRTGSVRVVALGARGGLRRLDSGPPADLPAESLALVDGRLTWQHSGQARTARLP